MANDGTWSAKVSAEIKEEISELIKVSGLTSNEFLDQLISNHKIGLLHGGDAQRSEDMQHVSYLLDKLKSSFISLVDKGIDLKDKYNESLFHESFLHKSISDQQQVQIKAAQDIRDKAVLDKATLEESITDIFARNSELVETNVSQRITINIQHEKINQLEDHIESITKIEEEVNRLNQENTLLVKRVESLDQLCSQNIRELEQVQTLREFQEKESIKSIEQIKQIHSLQIQRTTLETEKKMLAENQNIKDAYFSKIEALRGEIQELGEKVHKKELEKKELMTQTKAVKAKVARTEQGV